MSRRCSSATVHPDPEQAGLAVVCELFEGHDGRHHATLPDPVIVAGYVSSLAPPATLDWADEAAAPAAPDIDPDTVADGFGIERLGAENGAAVLTTVADSEQARALVLAMSDALGQMLDSEQAPNYVEFEVMKAQRPAYVVHVRRAERPTPHQLRRAAEARVAELEAQLERVEELLGYAWDDGNATGLDGWTGPGRGAGEVDDEAIRCRARAIRTAFERLATSADSGSEHGNEAP